MTDTLLKKIILPQAFKTTVKLNQKNGILFCSSVINIGKSHLKENKPGLFELSVVRETSSTSVLICNESKILFTLFLIETKSLRSSWRSADFADLISSPLTETKKSLHKMNDLKSPNFLTELLKSLWN